MKRIPLKRLEEESVRLLKGRHQPNTRKAYGCEIRKYLDVCQLYGWDVYPRPYKLKTMEHQIALFLAYLSIDGNNGWASLNSYVYAITAFMLERYNINVRTTKEDMPVVKGIILKKKKDKPSVRTRHIDKEMLRLIFMNLVQKELSDATYRFMFACAHNTMRRPREVLECDGESTLVKHIRFQNGTMRPNGKKDLYAVLGLKKSKMNKFREEQQVVLTCICPDVCALCELRNVYKIRKYGGWKKTDPLWVVRVQEEWKEPSYDNWRNKLKWLVRKGGYEGQGWNLHGCRGGGQGDARERGLSLFSIMQQAGWKSVKTVALYDEELGKKKQVERILWEQDEQRKKKKRNRQKRRGR